MTVVIIVAITGTATALSSIEVASYIYMIDCHSQLVGALSLLIQHGGSKNAAEWCRRAVQLEGIIFVAPPQCCLMSGRALLPPRWARPTTSNIPLQSASQGINWKGHGAQAWL